MRIQQQHGGAGPLARGGNVAAAELAGEHQRSGHVHGDDRIAAKGRAVAAARAARKLDCCPVGDIDDLNGVAAGASAVAAVDDARQAHACRVGKIIEIDGVAAGAAALAAQQRAADGDDRIVLQARKRERIATGTAFAAGYLTLDDDLQRAVFRQKRDTVAALIARVCAAGDDGIAVDLQRTAAGHGDGGQAACAVRARAAHQLHAGIALNLKALGKFDVGKADGHGIDAHAHQPGGAVFRAADDDARIAAQGLIGLVRTDHAADDEHIAVVRLRNGFKQRAV